MTCNHGDRRWWCLKCRQRVLTTAADSETRIFDDFREGRIDYDEMARRFAVLDEGRYDLAIIWTVALACIVIVIAVFHGT